MYFGSELTGEMKPFIEWLLQLDQRKKVQRTQKQNIKKTKKKKTDESKL